MGWQVDETADGNSLTAMLNEPRGCGHQVLCHMVRFYARFLATNLCLSTVTCSYENNFFASSATRA